MLKKIIIKTGVTKNVSFEELLEFNKGLIGLHIKKWYANFEYDDSYQLCCMALWKAYNDYDIERGLCFSTVANKYIFNILSGEYRKNKRHNVEGDSLEKELWEGTTLESKISTSMDFIADFETNLYIQQLLSNKEKTVLKLLSENYTQKQIAKALNTVQCNISKTLKRVRNKFLKEGYSIA